MNGVPAAVTQQLPQQLGPQPVSVAPRPVLPQMLPGQHLPHFPQFPLGGQIPGMMQLPGMPPMQIPGMPPMQIPGMPGMQIPGMPGMQIPGMPGQLWPPGFNQAQHVMQPQPVMPGQPQPSTGTAAQASPTNDAAHTGGPSGIQGTQSNQQQTGDQASGQQQQAGQQTVQGIGPDGVQYRMTINQATFAVPRAQANQMGLLNQQQPQPFQTPQGAFQLPGHPQFPQQAFAHPHINPMLGGGQAFPGMPYQHWPGMQPVQQTRAAPPASSETPLVCLLFNQTGPAAVVFHQDAVYRSRPSSNILHAGLASSRPPSSQQGLAGQNAGAANLPVDPMVQQVRAVAQIAGQELDRAQAAPVQQNQGDIDLLGPIQPLLGHLWLLLRILFFVYFFLGGSLGWRKPLILVGVCIAFYFVRAVFAEPRIRNAVRGWWEGVAGLPPRREQNVNQDQGQAPQPAAAAAAAPQQNIPAAPATRQNDGDLPQWRQTLRPVERALALFVASFWPGVGERTIRARRDE